MLENNASTISYAVEILLHLYGDDTNDLAPLDKALHDILLSAQAVEHEIPDSIKGFSARISEITEEIANKKKLSYG